jgi:hypothetical protein
MIKLDQEIDDDEHFFKLVEGIANGIITQHSLEDLLLIKIDNWFGPKWLGFSGKIFGALGVWNDDLRVPPFVLNRVIWEYQFSPPDYTRTLHDPPLHIVATSEQAKQRKISDVAPGKAILWFSGESLRNSRGSIMAYIPTPNDYWAWYSGWSGKESNWNSVLLKGISSNELASIYM